jgi:hypothetical protein
MGFREISITFFVGKRREEFGFERRLRILGQEISLVAVLENLELLRGVKQIKLIDNIHTP